MINIRNVLGAGIMMASALVAPTMMSAPSVAAVTETVSASPALPSVQKPCRKAKNPARCRARRAGNSTVGGGGLRGGIGSGGSGPSGSGHSRSRD
ncbi:hypothetical protein SAMN05216276_104029 [Streptosporangium subroseum]|uniref:Uncharacterized protein n=1 Tax=Streptosporangium subroseum TaxID=106412 RepID=A0A239MFQ4_9ACTN|nr:hypothetical protein [Streptosporangium subroseum]SNT40798.1 hypothetical protein SAMN05216276_104029 [Streptosporangium subroseum]